MRLEVAISVFSSVWAVAIAVGCGVALSLRTDPDNEGLYDAVHGSVERWNNSEREACIESSSYMRIVVDTTTTAFTMHTSRRVYDDKQNTPIFWTHPFFSAVLPMQDPLLHYTIASNESYPMESFTRDVATTMQTAVLSRVQIVKQTGDLEKLRTPALGYSTNVTGFVTFVIVCEKDPVVVYGHRANGVFNYTENYNNLDSAALNAHSLEDLNSIPIASMHDDSDHFSYYITIVSLVGFFLAAVLVLVGYYTVHTNDGGPLRNPDFQPPPTPKPPVPATTVDREVLSSEPAAPILRAPPKPEVRKAERLQKHTENESDDDAMETCLTASPAHSCEADPIGELASPGSLAQLLPPDPNDVSPLPDLASPTTHLQLSKGPVITTSDFRELNVMLNPARAVKVPNTLAPPDFDDAESEVSLDEASAEEMKRRHNEEVVKREGYTFMKRYEFKNGSHIEVYTRERNGANGLKEYFVRGELHVPAEKFFLVCNDVSGRKKWDKYCKAISIVEEYDGIRDCCLYWNVAFPMPFTARDYVYYREIRVTKGEIVTVAKAAPNAKSPPTKSVRVDNFSNHTSLTPSPKGEGWCCYTSLYFDDPKMNIPSRLMNWVTGSALPSFLETMFKVVDSPFETDAQLEELARQYSEG